MVIASVAAEDWSLVSLTRWSDQQMVLFAQATSKTNYKHLRTREGFLK
jgi:hypothetical protein